MCRWSCASWARMPRRPGRSWRRRTSSPRSRSTMPPPRRSPPRTWPDEQRRGDRRRMSILVGRDTRLLVQGITGREGEFHARAMLDYGTNIVAGVTPGKGGQRALDGRVRVWDTMVDAVRETGANASCIFVPAPAAPGAMLEAADAAIPLVICV